MAAAALSPETTKIAGALTSFNTTYLLNTNPMIFDDAEGYCNKMGGHLTSYGSSSEESDVVNYFTSSMGYLLAGNHSLYWMGLRSTVWPNFTWVDMSTEISGYDNWGTGNPDSPGAMCAGGNYSFDPKYSWDDVNCDTNSVFICELLRERRGWQRCMRCSNPAHCQPADVRATLGTEPSCLWYALPGAEKQVYTWTSDVTGNTYMLNTEPSNATAAQQFCNDNGGHLVSW